MAGIAMIMFTGCDGSDGTVGKFVPAPSPTGSTTSDSPQLPLGDGLQATVAGLTFKASTTSLEPGQQVDYTFRILDSHGRTFTAFLPQQTRLMHLYVVRSDLAAFQHVHPTMSTDGTWTASLQALQPGAYRAYAAFTAYDGGVDQIPRVLGDSFTVAGLASTVALPPPSSTAEVDGYTVTLTGPPLTAGVPGRATFAISKAGSPVTNLEPYQGDYADAVATRAGDLALAYFVPQGTVQGNHGGPSISFFAAPAEAGNYRLFVQFQTGGTIHTAALTVRIGQLPLGRWG
jgi:hypothetical protein